MKFLLKFISGLLITLILGLVLGIGILTLLEYQPEDVEHIMPIGQSMTTVELDKEYTALAWNIGYAGLDKDTDFFMDGGEMVLPISQENVVNAQTNILARMNEINADIIFIQEIDEDSKRTYNINQVDLFHNNLGGSSTFVYNYKAVYVPFPFPETLGKMASGLMMNTDFRIDESYRYQQPIPFKWPVRVANLKRAFNVSYLPISGSDKKLVVINVHLDAYDENNVGKIAQTQQLMAFAQQEYNKGNYVILGGDWNQDLSESGPMEAPDNMWRPEPFDRSLIPSGLNLLADSSVMTTATNHKPYDPNDSYEYVIDGFIVSDNVESISVEGLDEGFVYSDHNPVLLKFKLKSQ